MASDSDNWGWALLAGLFTTVGGAVAWMLWPRDGDGDGDGEVDNGDDGGDDEGNDIGILEAEIAPPYPLPRPWEASSTSCYKTKEPFNAAIAGEPVQAVALLNWLGLDIGLTELLMSDAVAATPVWPQSRDYTPQPSEKIQRLQSFGKSLKMYPAKVDGVIGECTLAMATNRMAPMKEEGDLPPLVRKAIFIG